MECCHECAGGVAECVHERNLNAKADAEAQFELACRDQVKIGARLRKTKEHEPWQE